MIVAVTGKGGTGKTIISTLLIKFLSERYRVLAVDADPDSNLPDALGLEVYKTLGDIKEEFQANKLSLIDKGSWLEGKVFKIIHEFEDFDLIVMGRSEGEGCYCFVNNMLRGILKNVVRHYDYVVVDCEAGLEHFSRKTIENADTILIVTDTSRKGLKTAKRIREILKKLNYNLNNIFLIGNKVMGNAKEIIKDFAIREGFTLLELLPYEEKIVELDLNGEPIVNLSECEFLRKVRFIADFLGWKNEVGGTFEDLGEVQDRGA